MLTVIIAFINWCRYLTVVHTQVSSLSWLLIFNCLCGIFLCEKNLSLNLYSNTSMLAHILFMSHRRNSFLPQSNNDTLLYFPLKVSKCSLSQSCEITLVKVIGDLHVVESSGRFCLHPDDPSVAFDTVDLSLIPEMLSPLGFCDTGLFLLFSCLTGFFVLISLGVLLLSTCWNVLDFCLPPLLVPSYTHSLSALLQPYSFKYLYSDACKKLYFSSSLSSELFCSIACRISNRHLKLGPNRSVDLSKLFLSCYSSQ